MSLATVASVVGIGAAGYSIYNQSQAQGGGGGGSAVGGPQFYVPTGLSQADQQWQQMMTQLFGNVSGTANTVAPDLNAAYQTLRGIPTSEIQRTGTEAGQYYQNLASQADQIHNIMTGHATDNLQTEKNLQGQGTDFMKQMLSLGIPLFGQGQDYQNTMQGLAKPLFGQGQEWMKQFSPMAANMTAAGNDYYNRMLGQQGDVIGAGKAFQQSQLGPASELRGAGRQLWETGLDPERKLADYLQRQVTEGSRAATSARGIGMSGNAAGLEDQAVSDFLMNWQDRQLGRQATGLQGMQGAFGQSGALENAGINALLNSYGIGGQLGGQGINALYAGNLGAGSLLNTGLQGMLGTYGQGTNMMGEGLRGMLGEYGMGTNMLNSGAQGQLGYFGMGNQYGTSGMKDLTGALAVGSMAPEWLQQSSMVPYLSQMFGPQMAMQFADMLGKSMNQDVYNPLAGAMGQTIPYMNYGQGATNSAFQGSQANMENLIRALGGTGGSGTGGLGTGMQTAWDALKSMWSPTMNPSDAYGANSGWGNDVIQPGPNYYSDFTGGG